MTSLTASRLLAIWEQGLDRPLLWKTSELLAAAFSGLNTSRAGSLSIGERDARLLTLREYLFGSTFHNLAACPQCSQPVEWQVNIADIRIQASHDPEPGRQFRLKSKGYDVQFRLPSSQDIEAVLASLPVSHTSTDKGDSGASLQANQLLERCILSVTWKGKPRAADKLPHSLRELVSQKMQSEDPQADIKMLLNCPYCKHSWHTCFDIAVYLWEEIHRWALRILHTVHRLAKAYHWSEHDILDMSPRRRQMYLQMIE